MAKQTGDAVMIKNGKEMLTMAVFAICITAPLGAILIATLGKTWLKYDAEFDTTSPHYKKESVEAGEVVDETVEAAAIEEDIEAAKPKDEAKVADEGKVAEEVKDKDPAKNLKKCMKKFLKSKNISIEEV